MKTAAKLLILEKYLKPYADIIGKHYDQSWYVDTHAGTGKTRASESILLDGSTMIALENHEEFFDRFYFYELNKDHFSKLHETLSEEFGYDFEIGPARVPGEDFSVARCDNPYIRIMQLDSNEGVQFLANHANASPHWFTLVDPKGLTAKKATLDTLIKRGNTDILINYQTTGVMRNASEAASHGHQAVTRTLGDEDWDTDGSPDDYVKMFKERLEENQSFSPVKTKNMEAPFDESYRFDLVFASANDTAKGIITDIWEKDSLWEEAQERMGQSGLGNFC